MIYLVRDGQVRQLTLDQYVDLPNEEVTDTLVYLDPAKAERIAERQRAARERRS